MSSEKVFVPPATHALIFKCRLCGERFEVGCPGDYAEAYTEFYCIDAWKKPFPPNPSLSGKEMHIHSASESGVGDLIGVRKLSPNESVRNGKGPH